MEIQKHFFETLKGKISPNTRLVDTICEILQIGSDSAYRRLRGETELTISELKKLCSHFNISMDAILNYQPGSISFKYSHQDFSVMENYEKYIEELATGYEGLAKTSSKEIIITAHDIPVVHFMPFLELMLFKVYAWNQSACDKPVSFEKFISKLDKDKLSDYYRRVINAYKQIPSTEIWTSHTIETILRVLDYHYDMNCFENKNHPGLLCYQVLQLVDNLEQWLENKSKKYNGKETAFRMYLSPLDLENIFVIAKNNHVISTSMELFTTNDIFTSNAGFCEETEKWLWNITSRSLSLTGTSARERFKFFQSMKSKVNKLMEKFEK